MADIAVFLGLAIVVVAVGVALAPAVLPALMWLVVIGVVVAAVTYPIVRIQEYIAKIRARRDANDRADADAFAREREAAMPKPPTREQRAADVRATIAAQRGVEEDERARVAESVALYEAFMAEQAVTGRPPTTH